jgi:hypothetical protein
MRIVLLCCNYADTLEIFEKIATIVIALATLFLGFYVFIYQKKKDQQANRLQWFKELIIQPKLNDVRQFYENLFGIKSRITKNDLTESEKIEIISFIKNEQMKLRKSFLDIIQDLTPNLYNDIIKNIDELTDHLTNTISNDELKLCNEKTYEREVHSKIQESNKFILKTIFNYNG